MPRGVDQKGEAVSALDPGSTPSNNSAEETARLPNRPRGGALENNYRPRVRAPKRRPNNVKQSGSRGGQMRVNRTLSLSYLFVKGTFCMDRRNFAALFRPDFSLAPAAILRVLSPYDVD